MRKRRGVPIGATGCAGVEGAAVTVQSVVVTGGRQLAWICAATAGTAGRVEVHKFDGAGAATLDASDSISAPDSITMTSLAISRWWSSVYWARGATAHMAPLC